MSGSDPTQGGNPYDPASMGMASQQPGMLGVSPSMWQSIGALGSGMVLGANQRTASGHLANGTGFAGGFASGVHDYLQNQGQQVNQRAYLSHLGQETQGLDIENQIKASGLPLTKARNASLAQIYSSPEALNNYLNTGQMPMGPGGTVSGPLGGGNPFGSGAPSAGPAPNLTGAMLNNESGGRTNTPGIVGDGGSAAGPAQVHQAALDDVNNAWGTNYTLPQLAKNPQLGTQVGKMYLDLQAKRFPNNPQAQLAAYNAGPGTVSKALATPQGLGSLPVSTQQYVRQGLPNQYDPSSGINMANQLMERANRVERARGIGLPTSEDPAALRAQALEYMKSGIAAPTAGAVSQADADVRMRTAGPIAMSEKGFQPGPLGSVEPVPGGPTDPHQIATAARAAESQKPIPIRGPGGANIQPAGPNGEPERTVQSPIEREILGPDNRKWMITQNAVETGEPYRRPTDVPAWAPKGTLTAVPSHLAPGEEKSQVEGAEEAFGEKARAQYAGALNTKRTMADVEHQFDQLNAAGTPGWYNSGPGAEWKAQAGKLVNSMASTAGLPPVFDTQKLAQGEDIMKQSKLLGMQVLQSLMGGSREAASIVTSTQGAVPNIENTPQGAKLLVNGYKEGANWQADQHVFLGNWAIQHNGNMTNADAAFEKLRPSIKYTNRAISQVQPFAIDKTGDPEQLKRFLPGTLVYPKGGDPTKAKMIPGPPDLDPIIPAATNANASQ